MKSKLDWKNDPFYPSIFKLVFPIVIQNLLSAAVNSADVVMLNFVGQSSISAVSLASQYASILFMIFYGLGTGATMLCAQYYGKGDMRAIQVIEGIALRVSILSATAFALAALCIPTWMMRIFTNDAELIAIGSSYLRFISIAYLCWGIIEVYLAILRSVGRVGVSTALNVLAFSLNIILNAVFLFGLFGAPKLGAMGVALATSLSRLIELTACFIVSAKSKNVKLDLHYIFVRNKVLFADFVKLSVPALMNDVIWGIAYSMYSVILGHLSSDAVAANSLVAVIRNFGTVLCFGLASGGGIFLGNCIGKNQLEQARQGARKLIYMTIGTGIIGGLIILAITPFVLHFAALTDQAMHFLKYMLFINSYYVMGIGINTMLICGVFRSGGDSQFGMYCDSITMWCYAVPLGFIAAFVLKLPVLVVYFLLCTDEFVKWPWVIKHYRSGTWLKNITKEIY
ncbi:MAG: MATE family efflux transporter [Lachnospiraceae bacterium]